MLRFLLLFLTVIILSLSGYSQDFWHEGAITLKNNLSITGELAFENNLVQIKYKSTLYSKKFSVNELSAFQFEDYELGINRYFVTDEINDKTTVFEVVVEGRYPVLRVLKENINFKESALLTEEDYNFYVDLENERVSFKEFDQVLKKVVWDFPFEMRDFIYKYNLNMKVTSHKVLLMQHYNALTAPNLDHSRTQKLLSIR